MFDKEIKFSAHEDYVALKEDYPIPTKLNIPEWYKQLDHTISQQTIKGCVPFLDTLTSGYLLKMPQDFYLRHNVDNQDKTQKDSFHKWGLDNWANLLVAKSINLNSGVDVHSTKQLGECPYIEKNKNLPFYKIYNPWKIKTPKGYSCLLVPPLNNTDDRFSIIPGIVDTDTFLNEINFPIVINGDKYQELDTTIKKGTPYVQVIPFKRDNWKMSIKSRSSKEIQNDRMFYELNILHKYKNKYWNKKSWK
jgi:hypothetical protein